MNVLGKMTRGRSIVVAEILEIQQKLLEIYSKITEFSNNLNQVQRSQNRDYQDLMRALGTYDNNDSRNCTQLDTLRIKKVSIEEEIQLWIDISFDKSSIISLRKTFFPKDTIIFIPGNTLGLVIELKNEISKLLNNH